MAKCLKGSTLVLRACSTSKNTPFIRVYDLGSNVAEILQKQTTLVQELDISGFCSHHCFFVKLLMEKTVDALLAAPYANENWTRRWDGHNDDVLIAQCHSSGDDIAFIRNAMHYFADSRYIRVRGRPILLVNQASLLPDMATTLERWRESCIKDGEAKPDCVIIQGVANIDPRVYGVDAAAQLPPHAD